MKLDDLLRYVTERGAAFIKKNGQLHLQRDDKLTPRCKAVLFNRRAEIYARYGVEMPEPDTKSIESCPHCGKSLFDEKELSDGEF